MSRELILTCDAGTTGCKCSVFNRAGTAIRAVKRSYKTTFPKPNWSEQDPAELLHAMLDGIRELLTQVNPADIAVIGLSGHMDGCIAVDNGGACLYPNIIHSDSRAAAEAQQIRTIMDDDEFYHLTGNRIDHHYTLPKILWLRKNMPDVYKRARWFLNIKDYLYAHLTGVVGVTDYSDASLTLALDINKKAWATDLIRELGADPRRMPVVHRGDEILGTITKEIAGRTGLLVGTPVALGGGDGACASRGAGLYKPGAGYCNIGSSAWCSQLTHEPILDPQRRTFNFMDMDGESFYPCGTVQTGASAFDWAFDNLLSATDENGNTASRDGASISRVENMARQIAPGAEGVFFLPTLMSERTPYWDANTRGCLMGFSLYHDQRHIARAVYEGVVFALNNVVEIYRECGHPLDSVTLIG